MTLSIPKTGSASVKFSNGSLVLWYQRSIRLWTLQQLNESGDQIGPNGNGTCYGSEASYHHRREDAVAEIEEILAADKTVLDAEALKGDAPGARAVTVEVDGRKLVMPRALFMSMMTFASNRANYILDTETNEVSREWLNEFVRHCWKASDVIGSR